MVTVGLTARCGETQGWEETAVTGQLEKFCDAEDDRGGVERKRTTVEDQDNERKDEDLTDVCTSHGRRENHGREPWQDGSEPELVFKSAWQWRSWWGDSWKTASDSRLAATRRLTHERRVTNASSWLGQRL